MLMRFSPTPTPRKSTEIAGLFLPLDYILFSLLFLVAARQELGRSPPAQRESFRVRLELGRGAGAPRGCHDVCSNCSPRCSVRWL